MTRNSKTADEVERIGFSVRSREPEPVMAVQFYQMAREISSEAKNEMNCDSESGSTALIRVKIILAGAEGFPLLRVTSLRRGTPSPIEANKAALSCLTQGSSVRAGLIGPTTCPGLSYYHLRGMVKGSKS